jgi:hypothetical protein
MPSSQHGGKTVPKGAKRGDKQRQKGPFWSGSGESFPRLSVRGLSSDRTTPTEHLPRPRGETAGTTPRLEAIDTPIVAHWCKKQKEQRRPHQECLVHGKSYPFSSEPYRLQVDRNDRKGDEGAIPTLEASLKKEAKSYPRVRFPVVQCARRAACHPIYDDQPGGHWQRLSSYRDAG